MSVRSVVVSIYVGAGAVWWRGTFYPCSLLCKGRRVRI
jgi:hypothetical protein